VHWIFYDGMELLTKDYFIEKILLKDFNISRILMYNCLLSFFNALFCYLIIVLRLNNVGNVEYFVKK